MTFVVPQWFVLLFPYVVVLSLADVLVRAYEWWRYPRLLGPRPGGIRIAQRSLSGAACERIHQLPDTIQVQAWSLFHSTSGLIMTEQRTGTHYRLGPVPYIGFIPYASPPCLLEIRVPWSTALRWCIVCFATLILLLVILPSIQVPSQPSPFIFLQYGILLLLAPLWVVTLCIEHRRACRRVQQGFDALHDAGMHVSTTVQ